MAYSESNSGRHLLALTLALGASLAITAYTAATSELPNMMGSSGSGFWTDRELRWSVLSSGLATWVGALAAPRSGAPSNGARAAFAARLILWVGLSVALCAVWFDARLFYAPLVAPLQAFAGIRLCNVWKQWRMEREMRRFR